MTVSRVPGGGFHQVFRKVFQIRLHGKTPWARNDQLLLERLCYLLTFNRSSGSMLGFIYLLSGT